MSMEHPAMILILLVLILIFSMINLYLSSKKESLPSSTKQDIQELKHWVTEQQSLIQNHQAQYFQSFQKQMQFHYTTQNDQLIQLETKMNENFKSLQSTNKEQLEKMRETVDEKLHKTLEHRLGKSFENVSRHLAAVQKGLGEMQHLANGVGDLKKVLSNVKTRGVMGEMLLGNILEQLLAPDQYALNVKTIPSSAAHVEFAIKFPGPSQETVWLPIDSKFPMDIYEKLLHAYEEGTPHAIDQAQAALNNTVIKMAREIKSKYIAPPYTTEFGILFLPVEGLYAEISRQPGLVVELQNKYRIMIAGPTNLAAFLNSLQLGFKTLAIEKRSSEVWDTLARVKTEFSKFGDTLEKVQNKLHQASRSIDSVGVRSRAIERNLRQIESGDQ